MRHPTDPRIVNAREEARKASIIAGVKAFAMASYNHDGWDYVVESFTDEEIWEEVSEFRSLGGAIKHMRWLVRLLDERRREVKSEAF